jgi:hypothetical protein
MRGMVYYRTEQLFPAHEWSQADAKISDHFAHLEDTIVQIAETLLRAASLHHQTVGSSLYSTEGSAIDQQGRPTEVLVLQRRLRLCLPLQSSFL